MGFNFRFFGELGRALFGLTYFMGALVHVYLWTTNQGVYAEITQFVLFDWYRELWTGLVLPNLGYLLPMLAAFEALVAAAVLARGRTARVGLLAGAGFNLAVAPLGFWWPSNVILATLHLALLRITYPSSTIDRITRRFGLPKVVG